MPAPEQIPRRRSGPANLQALTRPGAAEPLPISPSFARRSRWLLPHRTDAGAVGADHRTGGGYHIARTLHRSDRSLTGQRPRRHSRTSERPPVDADRATDGGHRSARRRQPPRGLVVGQHRPQTIPPDRPPRPHRIDSLGLGLGRGVTRTPERSSSSTRTTRTPSTRTPERPAARQKVRHLAGLDGRGPAGRTPQAATIPPVQPPSAADTQARISRQSPSLDHRSSRCSARIRAV